jgi:hypothetical protein
MCPPVGGEEVVDVADKDHQGNLLQAVLSPVRLAGRCGRDVQRANERVALLHSAFRNTADAAFLSSNRCAQLSCESDGPPLESIHGHGQ